MILSRCIVCQISFERAGDFPACGLALISPTSNFNTELREIEKAREIERERERERERVWWSIQRLCLKCKM